MTSPAPVPASAAIATRATTAPPRPLRRALRQALFVAAAVLLGLAWTRAAASTLEHAGLFTALGLDFGHYWAHASALRAGNLAAMYDDHALADIRRGLIARHAHRAPRRLPLSYTPYPPLFAWLFQPLTRLPDVPGYALWMAILGGAAVNLARRVAAEFPRPFRPWAVLLVFAHFSVGFGLFVGQVQILLAAALGECFLALRAGRDGAAGLWLGLTVLKPQYGVPLGIALMVARRHRAVLTAAATVAGILLASLAIVGPQTFLRYPLAALGSEGWQIHEVPLMVSWRSLLYWIAPSVDPGWLTRQSILLGIVTLALAFVAAHRTWGLRAAPSPLAFLLLLWAPILANTHMFAYGASVLVVPAAAYLATGTTARATRALFVAAAIAPTLAYTALPYGERGIAVAEMIAASKTQAPLLALGFIALLLEARRSEGRHLVE